MSQRHASYSEHDSAEWAATHNVGRQLDGIDVYRGLVQGDLARATTADAENETMHRTIELDRGPHRWQQNSVSSPLEEMRQISEQTGQQQQRIVASLELQMSENRGMYEQNRQI